MFLQKVTLKSRFYKKRNGYSWSASKFILKIVNIPSMLHYHPFRVERLWSTRTQCLVLRNTQGSSWPGNFHTCLLST